MRLSVIAVSTALIWPAAASERVNLDAFLAGLETRCHHSAHLEAFGRDLIRRYTFEAGAARPGHPVRIPEAIKPAMGRARAVDRGSWTEIRVPLTGRFRGLPTHALHLAAGHSNGVSVTTLIFDAPRTEVERVIGRDVRGANRLMRNEGPAGLSARIEAVGRRAQLVCDWST